MHNFQIISTPLKMLCLEDVLLYEYFVTSPTLFQFWWNTSDGIQLLGSSLKSCTWDSELIHSRAREGWSVRDCACVIVLFGSLPLGERVPVRISGIKLEHSLKLHFGHNMQVAMHLKLARSKAYSATPHFSETCRIAEENSFFLTDNPSKGNILQTSETMTHVSWGTRSGSTMSGTWSVGTLLFMEARPNFYVQRFIFWIEPF